MKNYTMIFALLICMNTNSLLLSLNRKQLCSAMARIECTYVRENNEKVTIVYSAHDGAGFACTPRKNGKGCEALSKDSPKVKKFCKDKMPQGCVKIAKIKVSVAGM